MFVLHALLAYAASVLLMILVGVLLHSHLDLLIVAGEISVAIPAAVVLLVHRDAGSRNQFSRPGARQFLLTILVGGCTVVIAVSQGIVARKMLLGLDPSGHQIMGGGSLLLLAILPPFCEELLFRPVLQNGLTRQWGPRAAVLGTAFFFGLFHLAPVGFGETFTIGLFAGIVYLRTGRFWCPVIVHFTCNALGPLLWRNAQHLTFLFHPVAVSALACVALAGCYKLGEASPVPLRGLWQRLNWAAFGTTMPGPTIPTTSRKPALLAGGISACLIAMMCYTHVMLVRQLRPPKPRSNYVVAEQDEWIITSPETIQARSTLTIQKVPKTYEDLVLQFPFPEARVHKVSLGDMDLPFSQSEPNEYRVDLSSQQDITPAGAITVLWSFPMTWCTLPTEERAYGGPLRNLVPAVSLSLKVTIADGSDFQFANDRQARTAQVVNLPPSKPKMNYCGWYGLRKKESVGTVAPSVSKAP
jgi:membrane protease YdiL (CAAX protease family)